MPNDDLQALSRLIAEAKRLAETHRLDTLAYLLDMAALELGQATPAPKKEPSTERRPIRRR
jgi:hypothetical protein